MIKSAFENQREGHAKIILWGKSLSPFVRKIMVALSEKNLSYELKETLPLKMLLANGQEPEQDFVKASPLGKIPALQIGNISMADSEVIAAYLDKRFPLGTALYPKDHQAYAKSLWFEKYTDTALSDVASFKVFFERVVKPNVFNQKTDEAVVKQAIVHELPPMLDYLETSLAEGPWFSGLEFSMADVAVAIQMLGLQMAGFDLATNRWPRLRSHMQTTISRNSFRSIVEHASALAD